MWFCFAANHPNFSRVPFCQMTFPVPDSNVSRFYACRWLQPGRAWKRQNSLGRQGHSTCKSENSTPRACSWVRWAPPGWPMKSSGLPIERSGLPMKLSGLSLNLSGLPMKRSDLPILRPGLRMKPSGLSTENSRECKKCPGGYFRAVFSPSQAFYLPNFFNSKINFNNDKN